MGLFSNITRIVSSWVESMKPVAFTNRTKKFYTIGHRGVCAYEVENTIPSFQRALDMGANALEMDISFTKDKIPVVWHDFTPDDAIALARRLGLESNTFARPDAPPVGNKFRKPTPELTLLQLRKNFGYKNKETGDPISNVVIPTLREFMEWAQDKKKLELVFFDTKINDDYKWTVPSFMKAVVKLMKEFNPHYKIVFMTPRESILVEMKKLYPDLDYTLDIELPMGIIIDERDFGSVLVAKRMKNKYASVGISIIGQIAPWATYKRVIKFDVSQKGEDVILCGWTINDEYEMRSLINLGVDGIVTDFPDKLAKLSNRLIPTTASGF
jgi:glycerophosphoryl diester phosphodiesterase